MAVLQGRIVACFRASGGLHPARRDHLRALVASLAPLEPAHVGTDAFSVTFAFTFDPSTYAAVVERVLGIAADERGQSRGWSVGIAQGDIHAMTESGSPLLESGVLFWGQPMIAASALATRAHPGEVVCDDAVSFASELVTSSRRVLRDGNFVVRGRAIDREQPWRRVAVGNLSRMTTPHLVHPPDLSPAPGALGLVRADPGAGGTRLLHDLASRAQRALVVSPIGSGFEPLGALRRAFERAAGEVNPHLLELGPALDALLAGKGVSLETAVRLVTAFLWPKQSGTSSVLLLDDAKAVDPATLEVCVRAVRQNPSFALVARLDASSGLPSVLATLPKAWEHEVLSLSHEAAEEVAGSCAGGVLDARGRRRWGRLGGGNPLAIVEAVAFGISSGDIVWTTAADADSVTAPNASPRRRVSGRGDVQPAAKWIRKRANAEDTPARAVLSALAVIGGEARIDVLERVFERSGLRIDVPRTLARLERSRWVVRLEPARGRVDEKPDARRIAFPSRTHQAALFNTIDDDTRRKLHLAIAQVIERGEGVFGRVEGAWHAAQAGEHSVAARALLGAARATADARLEASTTQLIAFARRVDPSCEEVALELLAGALERAPSQAPPPVSATDPGGSVLVSSRPAARPAPAPVAAATSEEPDSMIEHARIVPPNRPVGGASVADSEPPTMTTETAPRSEGPATDGDPRPPEPTLESGSIPPPSIRPSLPPLRVNDSVFLSSPPSPSSPGNQIAARLGELAKDALLAADNAALEQWIDGLHAAGESPAFTDRLRAMARLNRGDIGDALRVLRRTRAKLDPKDHRRRCQTSLALGVALSVGGRPQEALLEGLDALSRARQTGDERGSRACLAFLAKLYTSVSRDAQAAQLRQSST